MKIGPVLMIAGGAGLAAGTFTPWVTVKDVISKSGWVAGADGKVTLACGIIALVLGLVAATGKGAPKASLMIVGILAGLGGAGLAGYNYKLVRDLIGRFGSSITVGIGLYLCMVGGLLVVVGSVLKPKPHG